MLGFALGHRMTRLRLSILPSLPHGLAAFRLAWAALLRTRCLRGIRAGAPLLAFLGADPVRATPSSLQLLCVPSVAGATPPPLQVPGPSGLHPCSPRPSQQEPPAR